MESPAFLHPPFDFEQRIVTVTLERATVASIYVPNGGKDFAAKMRFLEAMDAYAGEFQATGQPLVLCGDLNVTRTDLDVHPKERKPRATGQLPRRALIERILGHGLVDVQRALHPTTPRCSRGGRPGGMRQRNIGWRLDYVLASTARDCRASQGTARFERRVPISHRPSSPHRR